MSGGSHLLVKTRPNNILGRCSKRFNQTKKIEFFKDPYEFKMI
jgi:hypothetical protein